MYATMEVMAPQIEGYYTVKEAAEQLGVGDQRVRDLIHEGRLQAFKIGRDWLVYRESVDVFERKKPGPKPHAGADENPSST